MKIDMNCFAIIKTALFIRLLPALFLLTLVGCEGGIIGTGTGPAKKPYELESLPERISPDIPKTLLKGEELGPSKMDDLSNYFNEKSSSLGISLRNPGNLGSGLDNSEGWSELHYQLFSVTFLRLAVETNSTIVDVAFNDILNECADQLIDCTIPADTIRVTLTQDVVDRLIQLHIEWAQSASQRFTVVEEDAEFEAMLISKISSLLNTEVVFGETHYSRLDGAPYEHSVRTSIHGVIEQSDDVFLPQWTDEDFYARWHEDGQVAKFIAKSADYPPFEYFYQNNVPGELAVVNFVNTTAEDALTGTYAKLIGNQPEEAGILLEVAAIGLAIGASADVTSSTGAASTTQITSIVQDNEANTGDNNNTESITGEEVVITSNTSTIERVYDLFQGQLDNSGGYATQDSYFYDLGENQNITSYFGYRESYDRFGALFAGERCFFDILTELHVNCDEGNFTSYGSEGVALSDSIHYFLPGEFDSIASMQDAIRWKVQGLPRDLKGLAVVAADSVDDLSKSELLCRGLQFFPGDVHVFCTATDDQLDNTVVVELTDGIPSRVISEASLVQIQ